MAVDDSTSEIFAFDSEATKLYVHSGLYLKPISKLKIVVTLPEMKVPGLTISNWEVMEKLKSCVAPDIFSLVKVQKSSLETIHFDAETETKSLLGKFISKLNGNHIKLSGMSEPLKIKASQQKVMYPKKHDWNSYFRDATGINECVPGERPDTIHLTNLPTKWFVEKTDDSDAFSKIIKSIFEQFGEIRYIDIPCCDPYRCRMRQSCPNANQDGFKTFSFGSNLHFDVYIQFKEYTGFVKAMEAFRGMKLMKIMDDDVTIATASIGVDFDRSSHLSAKSMRLRDDERKRLIVHDRQMEEEQLKKEFEALEEKKRLKEAKLQREIEEARAVEERKSIKEMRRKKREERRLSKQKMAKKRKQEECERKLFIEEKEKMINEQRENEAENLIKVILLRLSKRKEKEEEETRKRKAELEMRIQIEEKKRKLDSEKEKEQQKIQQRHIDLNRQELELREKLLLKLHGIEQKHLQKEIDNSHKRKSKHRKKKL